MCSMIIQHRLPAMNLEEQYLVVPLLDRKRVSESEPVTVDLKVGRFAADTALVLLQIMINDNVPLSRTMQETEVS